MLYVLVLAGLNCLGGVVVWAVRSLCLVGLIWVLFAFGGGLTLI